MMNMMMKGFVMTLERIVVCEMLFMLNVHFLFDFLGLIWLLKEPLKQCETCSWLQCWNLSVIKFIRTLPYQMFQMRKLVLIRSQLFVMGTYFDGGHLMAFVTTWRGQSLEGWWRHFKDFCLQDTVMVIANSLDSFV